MGINRIISVVVCCLAIGLSLQSYAQPRELNRAKWKELKREIDKRRYDARETISDRDIQRENRSYYDNENANKWSKDHPRMQDPNRKSDYSKTDNESNGDGNSNGFGNGDGNGS